MSLPETLESYGICATALISILAQLFEGGGTHSAVLPAEVSAQTLYSAHRAQHAALAQRIDRDKQARRDRLAVSERPVRRAA